MDVSVCPPGDAQSVEMTGSFKFLIPRTKSRVMLPNDTRQVNHRDDFGYLMRFVL